MKALCFYEHGGPDVLRYTDVSRPEPAPDEALVRVRATTLNRLDVFVRRGWPGIGLEMPHWGGSDVAGEVAQLGDGVAGWTVGNHQDFQDVMELIWAGKLAPVVDRVMPLSEGIRAVEILESGDKFGKIVLTP